MNRIKIYTDRHKIAEFERSVNETIEASNSLIRIFEEFQPFMRINSVMDFETLVDDPGALYDHLLTTNVQFNATAGMKVDPGQLAKLFNLDRENFLNVTAGKPIKIENCAPCGRVKIKQGKACISPERFNAYKEYMIFEEGEFAKDVQAVEAKAKDFDVYATTEQQIKVVDHYNALVSILNSHDAMFPLAGPDKETLTRIFGLHIERPPYVGKFLINSEHLRNSIYK